MAGLASINIRFKADLSGFSSELQNSLREIDKFGQKMQSVGRNLSAYITLPVLAAGGAAVKLASDYEESINKVDVAFGNSNQVVKDFAKTTLESFGIAEGTALDMAAAYGDMGTSMGLTTGRAAQMSTSLVALAGDLASFKNISVDVANTAISSIFTGETESLKKLGIVMTEANLQFYAISQGIKTKVKDMDQASKVNLRYAYIMSVTKNSQGDFVRTQGDAANQSRIFTESLKQLGQQFGQVILPYFTKMITSVNGVMKGFAEMSTAGKTTIVVVAGLAAVVGPLLVTIGAIASGIPPLVVGFTALRTAFTALSAAMLANPITAIALVVAAGAASMYAFSSGTDKATSSVAKLTAAQTQVNKITDDATAAIVAQKAVLQSYLDVAKDDTKSKKERIAAIKEINKISPELLGNINLENIATDKARIAIEKYNVALLAGAKARAAQETLQELYKKQIDTQLQREKAETNLNKLKEDSNKKQFTSSQAQKEYNDLLNDKTGVLKSLRTQEDASNQSQIEAVSKIYNDGKQYLDLLKETGSQIDINSTKTDKDKKTFAPGTIAFYEAQITLLKKQQNEVVLSSAAYKKFGNEIIQVQKKIDAISVDKTKNFTFAFKDNLPANGIDDKIKAPDLSKIDITKGLQEAGYNIDSLSAKMQYLADLGAQVGASVADAFEGMSSRLVASLGLANDGFGGFVSGLVQTVTKLIAMMLSAAISQSIAGATASGTATGPAAIFTTPAFIATAVGGVLAAFASMPKFETGGMVGGSSFYGDKILARVNSGEMIANASQQKNIWSAMNNSNNSPEGGFVASTKLVGSDMLVLIERAQARKNRIG